MTIQINLPTQIRGTLLVALSGTLYGVLGYFGTLLINEQFSISAMLFWRFFIAALWIFGSMMLFKRKLGFTAHQSLLLSKLTLFGVLTYCGSSLFYFMATREIGTGVAMVIFFAYPVFVTLFAWLSRDWQINKYVLLSLVAVILGLIFLKGHGKEALSLIGVLFASVASFCYALYVYGSQRSVKTLDTRLQTFCICLGNAIVFLLLSYANQGLMVPHTMHAWFYVLALGIVATALPIQLLLDGMKYISPIKASILSVLEPIVTVTVGIWFLQETLSLGQALGIVIVLMGAVLIQFEKSAGSNLPNQVSP